MTRLINLQLAQKIAGIFFGLNTNVSALAFSGEYGMKDSYDRLLEWWRQPEKQSSWPLWSRENSWTADIFISYVFAQLHRWALKLYNQSWAFQCTHQILSVILLKTFRILRSLSMLTTKGAVCFWMQYFTYYKGRNLLDWGR